MAATEPATEPVPAPAETEPADDGKADKDAKPDQQVATTMYAPNQQCVHADGLGPAQVHTTGATAGAPGAWTPAGSDPPNTVAELAGGYPLGITPAPTSNWTVGQYVVTGTAGPTGEANWNGTAWVAGRHP